MLPLYTSARLFQVNLCCFDREWSACRWRMKRQIQFATVFKNIVKKCNNSHQAAAISWVEWRIRLWWCLGWSSQKHVWVTLCSWNQKKKILSSQNSEISFYYHWDVLHSDVIFMTVELLCFAVFITEWGGFNRHENKVNNRLCFQANYGLLWNVMCSWLVLWVTPRAVDWNGWIMWDTETLRSRTISEA